MSTVKGSQLPKKKAAAAPWTLRDVWKKCLCLFIFSPVFYAIALIIMMPLRFSHLEWQQKWSDDAVFDEMGRRIFRTAFFGDSLIDFTDSDYGIISHIMKKLQIAYPQLAFDAVSVGEGGDQVKRLLARVSNDVLRHNPDCILIYFDSDATDRIDADKSNVKNLYYDDLSQLLQICTAQAPGCVGLGGPTLFGELPRGSNTRDAILDEYAKINAQVAAKWNVTYFHTRDIFFSKIPSYWMVPTGYLTLDGEHHNADGAKIIRQIFENFLVNHYQSIAAQYH